MARAFVAGLHRVTLQCGYTPLCRSKAPPRPPTANCFSTYPAVNANYRSPPPCRACAPDISSVFAGMYNLDPYLLACCTQPLPGPSACGLGPVPAYGHRCFGYAEAQPAPSSRNASVLFARVTYSEFGLTSDSNLIARYAARAAELESPQASTHSAFSRAPFRHLHLHHDLKDNTLPSPSAWDAVPPSSRSTRPCSATIVSNPPLHPAHNPMIDPLLPGCLAISVPAPPRLGTPHLPVHLTEYSQRHHRVTVVRSQLKLLHLLVEVHGAASHTIISYWSFVSQVTCNRHKCSSALRWFIVIFSVSGCCDASHLELAYTVYFDISDILQPTALSNPVAVTDDPRQNPYQGFSRGFSPALHNRYILNYLIARNMTFLQLTLCQMTFAAVVVCTEAFGHCATSTGQKFEPKPQLRNLPLIVL